MSKVKISIFLQVLLISTLPVFAQTVDTAWTRRLNEQGNSANIALAMDMTVMAYVPGQSTASGHGWDHNALKYDSCRTAGDANGDGKVTLPDLMVLIYYIFRADPPPNPVCIVDVNDSGTVTLVDVVILFNFIFKGAPTLIRGSGCCL